MRSHRSFGVVVLMAGLLAPVAATALPAARLVQTEPVPGQTRQRAPGVPLAPNPAEAGRAGSETPRGEGSLRGGRTEQAQRNGNPEPNRDPPMPRPVPSIIQN